MLRNRKAHIDPICISTFTLVLVVGFLILWNIFSGVEVLSMYVLVFAALALLSQVVHLFHHGMTPVDIVCSIIIFLIAIFLIRFSIGNVDVAGEFYYNNLKYIVPVVILLDGIKTIL